VSRGLCSIACYSTAHAAVLAVAVSAVLPLYCATVSSGSNTAKQYGLSRQGFLCQELGRARCGACRERVERGEGEGKAGIILACC
jgi:hypothetical protein